MQQSSVSPDQASLGLLDDFGFTGGREAFRRFCAAAFAPGTPRYLRTADGALVVFRHADLRRFAARPDVGGVTPAVLFGPFWDAFVAGQNAPGTQIARVIANQVFTANPPLHGPLRKVLAGQLGPREVLQFEALATACAESALDALSLTADADGVVGLAEPYVTGFWAHVLGMTTDEAEALQQAAHDMTALFHVVQTEQGLARADHAMARYGDLVERAAMRTWQATRDNPATPGSAMIASMAEGLARVVGRDDPLAAGIVPANVGRFLAGNLVDGVHTAAVGAANALLVLGARAAECGAAPDRALMTRAVMEALRLEPPVLGLQRLALSDIAEEGVAIPAGTRILMLWAAGNHDPAVFPDPARFSLDRQQGQITTFGGGAHICPGRTIAVMLARVLVEAAWRRGLGRVSAPPVWFDNLLLGQMAALPLATCADAAKGACV